MKDGYFSDDIFFAATMIYLFGPESLQRIEINENGRAGFTLDIPSLDAQEYWSEFNQGTLAVTDVKSLARAHGTVMKRLREMRQAEETVWDAPRSQAWWIQARAAVQEKQRQREYRERRN